MIELVQGDILEADAEALVNAVNCVGPMGRGVAAQFKRAFPANFRVYQAACKRDEVQPGQMLVVETGRLTNPRFIINFPTKRHWRGRSQIDDIEAGLTALVAVIGRLGIRSVAVPALGCGLGGLDWSDVRPRIERALAGVPDVRVLLLAPRGEQVSRARPDRDLGPPAPVLSDVPGPACQGPSVRYGPMEMGARRRIEEPEYRAPAREQVETVPAERLGVSNGLLLRFPRIHCVGDLALLDVPGVAIVGARKASAEGRKRASQLARDLARAGVVVVSGLAEGIDFAAQTAAIDNGGRTIAVIGTPLDKVYPEKHAALQELIYREHLLVSAFEWGDKFTPSNFPERNRIMARLARATVIIEASDTSGSLHQAAESVQVGHPVFIAKAVVDNPKLTWPRRFLGEGKPLGRVLTSSADVVDAARG